MIAQNAEIEFFLVPTVQVEMKPADSVAILAISQGLVIERHEGEFQFDPPRVWIDGVQGLKECVTRDSLEPSLDTVVFAVEVATIQCHFVLPEIIKDIGVDILPLGPLEKAIKGHFFSFFLLLFFFP